MWYIYSYLVIFTSIKYHNAFNIWSTWQKIKVAYHTYINTNLISMCRLYMFICYPTPPRIWQRCKYNMMTSSNGNIFRVTGPLCGEFTGPGEFPVQRPVTRSFDVFFNLRLNKRLSKQPWGWWFEMPSWSLWRQCNDMRLTHNNYPQLLAAWDVTSMAYVRG